VTDEPQRDSDSGEVPDAEASSSRAAEPAPNAFLATLTPEVRFLVIVTVLALVTRLVWVLFIHPPEDYIFSDMKKYVVRAQFVAEHGFVPGDRTMAWQAWGTHTILAIPYAIFGVNNHVAGAIAWALMGASAIPLGYLVACRVCTRQLIAKGVAITLLLWHPHLSNTGNFLSETPFLCFQLWSTYWLLRTLQDGKRSLGAGIVSAIAFAIRPQSAAFFLLVLLTWFVNFRRLPHVRYKQIVGVALPLLLMLGFSFWRFHAHAGYGPGVAENANMNLTAGRCHNIVTQAFPNEGQLRRSERANDTRDGRRVSLPGYRMLKSTFPDEHPLGLRPALGGETIRFVGYIGDPLANKAIRAECYRRTGTLEQIRYSVVNMWLLWFISQQWPEMEKGREWFLPPAQFFTHVYQVLVWLPSLIGLAWAIAWIRKRPALTIMAWHLVSSMTVAAVFFGDIRLRLPYDPYAIILAWEVWAVVILFAWGRLRKRRVAES
jgi:hypothetical protein